MIPIFSRLLWVTTLGSLKLYSVSVIVLGSTTDFGTFVLLPPFLKTYLGG